MDDMSHLQVTADLDNQPWDDMPRGLLEGRPLQLARIGVMKRATDKGRSAVFLVMEGTYVDPVKGEQLVRVLGATTFANYKMAAQFLLEAVQE